VDEAGRILAHEGLTSRLPGSVQVIGGRGVPRFMHDMRDRMSRLGAKGYYLVHNHPGGEPHPSASDILLSRAISRRVPGFLGHVIIDSGLYGFVGADLRQEIRSIPNAPNVDRLLSPSLPGEGLGESVARGPELAALAKRIQTTPGYVTLLYADAPGRVRAIQEMPEALFRREKDASDYIRGRARDFGAANVFAYYEGPAEPVRALVRAGTLTDAVTERQRMSLLDIEDIRIEGGRSFGRQSRTIRVEETQTPYATAGKIFDGDAALERLRRRGRGQAYDLGAVLGQFPGVMRDVLQYAASRIEDVFRATGRMPDFAAWARSMEDGLRGVVSGIGKHLRRLWGEARAMFRRRAEAAGERRGPSVPGEERPPRGAQPPPPPRGPRGQPATGEEPARVPFIITQAQRSRLRDLGYSEREIDRMRPAEAQEVLRAGRPAGTAGAERMREVMDAAGQRAERVAQSLSDLRAKERIARENVEDVRQTGTLRPEDREPYRRAGTHPTQEETREQPISREAIEEVAAQWTEARRALDEAERVFRAQGDALSNEAMAAARAVFEAAHKRWLVYRAAWGHIGQAFQNPIPESAIQGLTEAANIMRLAQIRERIPITTNIIESLKRWPELTDAEKRQFWRDLIDQYRLNLFSTTSFTLDLFGNAAEIGAQGIGGAAYDLIHLARGHPSFPSLQGFLRAIRSMRNPPQWIADAFDRTVSGERIVRREGAGAFTYRSTPWSKFYDLLIGLPLYLKSGIDTAAKRFSSMAALWREAYVEADRRGLRGADRQAFLDEFVNNPPEAVAREAIKIGNKAGFNREMSHWEEMVAESLTARLFVAPFARWPFQFTRWAAEMVGLNPEVWGKIRRGTITPEELGAYLARSATGLGGLYLLNRLYDRVDFNSMEYVDADGNRIRLAGREPLPTAFWFLAVIRGDEAKAFQGLRHASVPFASLLGGDGGLLTNLVQSMHRAVNNQRVDTRAVAREIEDTINRAIPGQAVLAFVETLIDPTLREGVGANLPGISLLKRPAINVVTGEPLEPRQRFLGVELPTVAGTPIPGATRLLEPVQKLLSRYGLLVYRGPRSPIAGLPPGEAPEELHREWVEEFGRARARLLSPLARAMKTLEAYPDEKVRKMIQARDSMAARLADAAIRARHGGPKRIRRQRTLRELAGPVY
jgi:hypothetical protein